MDTHLSRWQLSIEPQGQWRDRRKPLSSSFWLLLSPLHLLSLLAFNCTFLCVQNSQSSNTLVQDSSNLFTIGVPACPCFALSSALFPLSPFIHSDLFEFWAREQNPQQMIDLGLRGSKLLAPCLLDQNSERILVLVECFGSVHGQSRKSAFRWGSAGVYLWLAWLENNSHS